jgi:hypothetical protein
MRRTVILSALVAALLMPVAGTAAQRSGSTSPSWWQALVTWISGSNDPTANSSGIIDPNG